MRKKLLDEKDQNFKKALDKLNNGEDLNSFFDFEIKKSSKKLVLLSVKPKIIVCNVDEDNLKNGNEYTQKVKNKYRK